MLNSLAPHAALNLPPEPGGWTLSPRNARRRPVDADGPSGDGLGIGAGDRSGTIPEAGRDGRAPLPRRERELETPAA
jgi:hypothetical protein